MASIDEDKVMDVSKPGKGRIITTSRPVMSPVSQISVKTDDVSISVPKTEPEEPLAPSLSHKIIEPLNEPQESTDNEVEDNIPKTSVNEASDSAGVDEIVKVAESKKLANKEAMAQVKKDEELQKLIDSKKYVVPISHDSRATKKKTSWWLSVIAIAIILFVAGYLLIDSGTIKTNIALPVEFFKETEVTTVDSSHSTQTDQAKDEKKAKTPEEKPVEETPVTSDPGVVTPEIRARDTDRKNELKNLQQKLETYFNDNDAYPTSLAELQPVLNQDALAGPGGDKYTYSPSVDNQSYELSAILEDVNDRDAQDGKYILMSVNQ